MFIQILLILLQTFQCNFPKKVFKKKHLHTIYLLIEKLCLKHYHIFPSQLSTDVTLKKK